jgi:hypothetical protein
MFCSRIPSPKIIKRWWNPDAISLTRPGSIPQIDHKLYYGWCVHCRQIKPCGEQACGDGIVPRLEAFECEQCETTRLAFETSSREISDLEHEKRLCPECNIPTIRYAGCNHITCPCGAHWCYECGDAFEYSKIYRHMNQAHGRIYSYETPEFDFDFD